MNQKIKTLFCVLPLCAVLPAALGYVMGPDNRVEITEEASDADAIRQTGMLRIQDEEFVSGLLTGENCDVVISAGHAAIYWESTPRKGWVKGEVRGKGKFRFNIDPEGGGDWQDMALVTSGYAHDDHVGKDEHDWSIFRISSPALSDCKIISVLKDKQNCKSHLQMAGFHFDRPATKLIDRNCSVKRSAQSGIIIHDCDTKDGSSGSPLFCEYNGEFTLLAINISGLTNRDYYDAGVYGKSGRAFHYRQHKNFAIAVGGEFYHALMREMSASKLRRNEEKR